MHSCCTQGFKVSSVPTCYCALQTQLLNLFPPWIDAPCVWWQKSTHPSCASTFSSTGTPPHKPPSAAFPAKGGRWACRFQGPAEPVPGRALGESHGEEEPLFALPVCEFVFPWQPCTISSPRSAVQTAFRWQLSPAAHTCSCSETGHGLLQWRHVLCSPSPHPHHLDSRNQASCSWNCS